MLWNRLPTRTLKTRLSRLLHYCSAAGVKPEDSGEATFAEFREHLELTLLKEPPAVFRETLLGWNMAGEQVTGWPELALVMPDRRTAWTLPWSEFPESLHRDVTTYLSTDSAGGTRSRSCPSGRRGD